MPIASWLGVSPRSSGDPIPGEQVKVVLVSMVHSLGRTPANLRDWLQSWT